MIYLLAGTNRFEKDKNITSLKKDILGSDAGLFDLDIFYGDEADADTLQKSLLSLPAMAAQRLIVLYQAQKLNENSQRLIMEWAELESSQTALVLDFDRVDRRETFFKNISLKAKTFIRENEKLPTVFDAMDELKRGKCAAALSIINVLLDHREDATRLLGGVLWSWGKERHRMPDDKYKKGLLIIQEADGNIKRSRLAPNYALEVAITKLFSLEHAAK